MRDTDPKTAPTVPINITLDWSNSRRPAWEVVIEAWERTTDKKIVYTIKVDEVIMSHGDLDPMDKDWLKNIGARP